MIKIQIKDRFTGSIIFEYEKEKNTIFETVKEFIRKEIEKGKSGAYLSGAYLAKRYIQVSCIGSRKRMTTYCFEDDVIWCGCFKGSLNEFENKVKETHENNELYLKEYLGFINYLKSLK